MSARWIGSGRWLVLAVATAVAFGCGDPESPADNQQNDDNGVENDVGSNADAGGNDDNDIGNGNGDDHNDEQDIDEGVDGPGDNCPEISNPDQADRSRDGVGDACANFPYYHDPSNPESLDVLHEDDGGPNDNFWEARENWLFEAPVVLEGTIAEPGELDWYAIEVDEPTTLMFHLEAESSSLWPALILRGDDYSTYNTLFSTPIIGANQGASEVRDVHLPLPGIYTFVVSDFNNFTASGGSTGGDDYDYRVSVSNPPLPASQSVSLPMPRQVVPYDSGEAQIFSFDVEGEDALYLEATGAPRNQNSMLFPSIQVLNGETGEMLAYTLESQVDNDSMRNELTIKVGDLSRVDVLVEGHQTFGSNDIVVDINAIDKPVHYKSHEEPRRLREDHLLWLRPGSFIDSMIGPPIADSDTSLEADEDMFLMYTQPGDFFRVEAQPHPDSLLVPEVALGRLSSFGSFFDWHRGFDAFEAGEASSLSAYVTTNEIRDSILYVAHAYNFGNSLPVGGPDYGYELSVQWLDVDEEAEQFGDDFPYTVPVILEAGQQGLYDFDFQPGFDYDIDYDGNFSRRLQLIDRNTGELIDDSTSSLSFFHRPDRNVILGIRDNSGSPVTQSQNIELEVSQAEGPQDIDIDQVIDSQLDDSRQQEVFRLQASAGEFIEVRTASGTGPTPQVELVGDLQDTAVAHNEDGTMAGARVDSDTELLAIVSRSSDVDVDYSLGAHSIDVADATAPTESFGELDELRGAWWKLPVDEQHYTVNVTGYTDLGDELTYDVFDADTLERIDGQKRGFGVFEVGDVDEVYVAVGDPEGPVSPTTDFGVSIASVSPSVYDGSQTVEFAQGLRPAVVAYDIDEAGFTTMDFDGDQDVATEFRNMSYEVVGYGASRASTTAVASGQPGSLRSLVYPRDHDADSQQGELDLEHRSVDEVTELSAGEAASSDPLSVDTWPGAFGGTVDSDTSVRSFSAELDVGQSVSVFALPAGETSATDMDPWLELRDPDGIIYASDSDGGEGDFPQLNEVEIDEYGIWTIDFGIDVGVGDFALFMMRH